MDFSSLRESHTKWRELLVIGQTIERDGRKYHLLGMTLSQEARLYFIEPCPAPRPAAGRGVRSHRRSLKEEAGNADSYLHCSGISLGNARLLPHGGFGGPLLPVDYRTVQLFFDMMSAGWTVPEWLQDADWDTLQLVTLQLGSMERLPCYSPGMPIAITHRPDPIRHILEKPVTLTVGKARSLCFTDRRGEQAQCHINRVSLIDVWKDAEEEWKDPSLAERFTPQQLEEAREHVRRALELNCPRGMCYVGIEYECSQELSLVFYSREYLKSTPEAHQGSAAFLMMRPKPDRETGTHGLPLKCCMIHTPFPPDTVKIPAELFLSYEKAEEWTETLEAPAEPKKQGAEL